MSKDHTHTTLAIALLAVLTVTASIAAANELDTRKNTFKACVDARLASERARDKPKADALLTACQTEFQELVRALPAGTAEPIKRFIKDDIDRELGKPGK